MTKSIVTYSHPNLQVSPRKLRLLANSLNKKLPYSDLLTILRFTNSKPGRVLYLGLKNLLADAKTNHHLDPSSITLLTIRVDDGPKRKTIDKSHGSRFARGIITKRHSRLILQASGNLVETKVETDTTPVKKQSKLAKSKPVTV